MRLNLDRSGIAGSADRSRRGKFAALRLRGLGELERNIDLFGDRDQCFVHRLLALRDAGDLAALAPKQVIQMEQLLQSLHQANEPGEADEGLPLGQS
jgi:hypothetical protein